MKLGLILVSLLLTAAPAFSYPLNYLNDDAVDTLKYNPPQANSTADLEDLRQVLLRTRRATAAECARARSQYNPSLPVVYGHSLKQKVGLSSEDIKSIDDLIGEKIARDVDYFVNVIKIRTNRPRPYLRDERINEWREKCIKPHSATSYLSGHSAMAKIESLLLTTLYPQHKDTWAKEAALAAENRVLAGLHHYTDVQDGAKLAEEVYGLIKLTPLFRKDLAELKRHLNLK